MQTPYADIVRMMPEIPVAASAILLCVASVSSYRKMQLTGNKVIAIPLYFKEQIEKENDFNTWFNCGNFTEGMIWKNA